MFKSFTVKDLVIQASVAALYVVLVVILPWISFSAELNLRIAEALLVLVVFSSKHTIGLVIGTFIANLASPYGIGDSIFGSLATLIVCIGIIYTRKYWYISILLIPPLVNGVIVALVASASAASYEMFLPFMGYVALGEFLVLLVLGIPLYLSLNKLEVLHLYLKA